MPDSRPDFESMSDEEAKELFMSMASDDDHRRFLQELINALLDEAPDLTEGEVIRGALAKVWEETEPTEHIGHIQHIEAINRTDIRQDIFYIENGKARPKFIQHPNTNKPGSPPNDESDDDPPAEEDATD